MEQMLNQSAEELQQIDPEVFRRVWERVMPDEKISPIVVRPAEGAPAPPSSQPVGIPGAPVSTGGDVPPAPVASPQPAPPQPSAPPTPRPLAVNSSAKRRAGEEEIGLRELMDMVQTGGAAAQALARRAENGVGPLSGLATDHRKALRKLSAAYFLETGNRYQPKPYLPARSAGLIQGLRDQYLWEQRWGQACLQVANCVEEPSIRELCRDLAQDASLHTYAIRRALEQKI